MSTPRQSAITIAAPAKLNLGLEVIGKRPDGYHDLATIFLTVDRVDSLILRPSETLSLRCASRGLETAENLVLRALRSLQTETSCGRGASVELQKRIPEAAGLGGASSDAAAALIAARQLWHAALADEGLAAIAARLGSDVPFFLRGGCALGHGRGERLEPLPLPRATWFVVVAPPVRIARKTATLYAALRPDDFSNGARIAEHANRLRRGQAVDPLVLGNAFARPLYALAPVLQHLPGIMHQEGAPNVALSGAGPAHYAVFSDPEDAVTVAARLRERLEPETEVFLAAPVAPRLMNLGQYDGS